MDASQFLQIVSPSREDPTVMKIGTIPASYTTGRPTITFDGESTTGAKTYPHLDSYSPAASDRVLIALVGHSGVILGKLV